MEGFPERDINPLIRRASHACGDPLWDRASSHGFRRGRACDFALEGGTLGQILLGGDWKSSAFRAYIHSVSEQLHSQALLHVLGNASDSE